MKAHSICKGCGKQIDIFGRPNRRFCDSLCRTIYHARQDLLAQTNYSNTKPQRACELCKSAYNPETEHDKYCTETCKLVATQPGAINETRRNMLQSLPWAQRYAYRDALAQNRLDRAVKRYAHNKARKQHLAHLARADAERYKTAGKAGAHMSESLARARKLRP